MFARVTSVTIQPNKIADATRIFNESIIPAVKAGAGNRGIMLLVDPATGKGMSISLWNSEAEGQAYDTSGSYREQVAKVAPFFAAPPSLATYDVPAQA
jgi:heme-degrading monooxygenase HmoA